MSKDTKQELRQDTKKDNLVPTNAELGILKVLWKHGPSTVRFVHDQINPKNEVGYTTTLKVMQVMTEKGMLSRDQSSMKHIFSPLLQEEKTKAGFLRKFVDSMYSGSLNEVLVALVDSGTGSAKEIKRLKEIIKKLEK
jgi:BlaI family transcriptional regulator, penicillinase repressor